MEVFSPNMLSLRRESALNFFSVEQKLHQLVH